MMWSDTVAFESRFVFFCRISGVSLPPIAGVLLRQIHHQTVTPHFRHNWSRSNRKWFGIALNQGRGWGVQTARDHIAIDQNEFGWGFQTAKRSDHRNVRRAQDVMFVNFITFVVYFFFSKLCNYILFFGLFFYLVFYYFAMRDVDWEAFCCYVNKSKSNTVKKLSLMKKVLTFRTYNNQDQNWG